MNEKKSKRKRITVITPVTRQRLFQRTVSRFLEFGLDFAKSRYERKGEEIFHTKSVLLDIQILDRIDKFIERENKGKSYRKKPIKSWAQALRIIIEKGLESLGVPK